MSFRFLIALSVSAAALAGCVSVDGVAERERALSAAANHADPVAPYDVPLPQAGETLSEDGAAALAIARNPALRAQLSEAGLARADWAVAVLPPNPVVELTWFNPEGAGAVLDMDVRAPAAALLGYPMRRAAARAAYDGAQARAVLDAINFAADARRSWVEAVAANERAALQQQILQSAEAALVVAEEIDTAGNAPSAALARQQLMTLAARTDADDARQAAMLAGLDLEVMIAGEAELPDRLPDPARVTVPQDAAERALAASLPLAAARAEAERAARVAGYETLDSLLGAMEIGPAFDIEGGETETGISAHLDLPLFGLGHPQRAAAQIRAQQAADRYTALEAEIRAAITAQVSEMEWASERARFIREELLPASTRSLDETMRQYNAMQTGVYALLDAFNAQVSAGRAYVDAMARYHRARIAYMAMMQGGSPAGVQINAPSAGEAANAGEDH